MFREREDGTSHHAALISGLWKAISQVALKLFE